MSHILFLFLTQAEATTQDALSERGGKDAAQMATTLKRFLSDSLKIDLETSFHDPHWKQFKTKSHFKKALEASLNLFPVLLVGGQKLKTQNTCAYVAQELALPICVDDRFDDGMSLEAGLKELLTHLSTPPKLILVGTSLDALSSFIQKVNADAFAHFKIKVSQVQKDYPKPMVLMAGLQKKEKDLHWIIDL
jgi:hypothetical protein